MRTFAAASPGETPRFAAAIPALVAAAILLGALVVFTESLALLICASLIACAFILRDFRIGVVLLIVLMPVSASSLVPRGIGGIQGLSPQNLLLLGTFASYLLVHLRSKEKIGPFAPRPLVWLYVAPMVVAGLIGSMHVREISSALLATHSLWFQGSIPGYLSSSLVKPLSLVLFALLVGAALARSRRPQLFLIPTIVSVWCVSLLTIVFVLLSGISLSALASSTAREFLTPLDIHANDLGRMYAVAYALMLFTAVETEDRRLRIALFASMAIVVTALVFTFSRAAFLGFAIVNFIFLATRRNATTLTLAVAFVIGLALLLPGAVYERMQAGWGADLNTISAGRIDHLWLPLLPEVLDSPIWGHGLRSILWSDAMHTGKILPVTHPHNAYLQAAMDMGIVGLILLCTYFAKVWKHLSRLGQEPAIDAGRRGFYTGAAVGLVASLIAGLTGGSLMPSTAQFYLWVAIGMMYGEHARLAHRAEKKAEAPADAATRRTRET